MTLLPGGGGSRDLTPRTPPKRQMPESATYADAKRPPVEEDDDVTYKDVGGD